MECPTIAVSSVSGVTDPSAAIVTSGSCAGPVRVEPQAEVRPSGRVGQPEDVAAAIVYLAGAGFVSPIVMAWTIAALIRLGTGSATVATITAAGVMPSIVASTGASPEWVAIAIGAGSVFFSHVNDAGFWLVKSYLGTSTKDTFKTWSLLETVISVAALLIVLLASKVTAG